MNDSGLMDDDNVSYDKAAKRFLAKKILLAWILKYLVTEFKDFSVKEIADKCIEGDPTLNIETISVDTDYTKLPQNIKGERNENSSVGEGTAIFDIMFRAVVPTTNETVELIINIEPQRTMHTGYSLLRRAIFYASRMISAQKETEFTGEEYDKIKKVYTIWLVMDAPKGGSNSIRRYEIKEKIIHGRGREDLKNYDLIAAVMVYLGNKASKHRLLRLLRLIFLDKLKTAEKTKILKRDYDLVLTPVMKEDLRVMGSLALGIADRAEAKGENKIMDAIRMLKDNLPTDKILKKTGMSLKRLTELKTVLGMS